MDFVNFAFVILFSMCSGIVITFIVQYYVLVRYFNKGPIAETPKKLNAEAYSLPEELKKKLNNMDNNETPSSADASSNSVPVSLLLQFLFHELCHSDGVKQWLFRKLSLEFDELLTKTTIGKFFEAVTIRDMHLGSQFPDIKDINLDSIQLDPTEGYIDTLNLAIKLDYSGNFLLSVDAKMKFGKTAYLSIKVKRISGIGRLQFTRLPYTHWSFSFYMDPQIDLAVESHFQGRQLQQNITNLIVNQIKKAIKRKHTMPNYKIRYKPFFVKTDPGHLDDLDHDEAITPSGTLQLNCSNVSRLSAPAEVNSFYLTLTLDSIPFICLYEKQSELWLMLELTLMFGIKGRQQQLGVIFKQANNGSVVIESVAGKSPAWYAGLRAGDIVLAIENKSVSNVSQVSKLIKGVSPKSVSFKIERCTKGYAVCDTGAGDMITPMICVSDVNDDEEFIMLEKTDRMDRTVKDNISSKFAQTIGNFSLRKRKSISSSSSIVSNCSDSNKSTPTPSCPNTPQHFITQHFTKKHSISEMSEDKETPDTPSVDPRQNKRIKIYKTKELQLRSSITLNDDFVFALQKTSKFLNVNAWGVAKERQILLGYCNITLAEILSGCCNSLLGTYTKCWMFLPPNNQPPNQQSHPLMGHSGFEHVFCYGDMLLSFVWKEDQDQDHGNDDISIKGGGNSSDSELRVDTRENHGEKRNHDFVRTQFHRCILCDFCSKKIWLKDAVQCRDCGMCCHKKCISKCQLSTDCQLSAIAPTTEKFDEQADSLISDVDICCEDAIDDDANSTSNIVDDASLIKRVSSVNNLSIPGTHSSSHHHSSRSLPPSPQRTPSRKHSLVEANANPFALCALALEDVLTTTAGDDKEAFDAVNRLLDQMLVCATDESLMESARESGRQMYAEMVPEEKIEKINAMMGELKKMFDLVTTEHAELIEKLNAEGGEVERAKVAFLLGQADAKIHGLSVLMLHYCSGLQQT